MADDLKYYLSHDDPRVALKGVYSTLSKETTSYTEWVLSLGSLATKLFGFGNETAWVVLAENDEYMYEYVIKLLEPEGPLFTMFFRNMGDVYQNTYFYPVAGLSFGMRTFANELKEKKNDASNILGIHVDTPVFRYFNEKIKTMVNKNIQLNMFEYFLFCFFNFVTTNKKMTFKTEQKIPKPSDADNFAGFLSKLAPIRPEASRQSSRKPPVTFLFSKYLNFFFPLEKRKEAKKRDISNTFLFILTDFLFNQMIERSGNYTLSAEMNDNATKFTYFTSVTVKHLLRLGDIAESMRSTTDLVVAANLKENIALKLEPYSIVQYPAYRFLKTMFIGLKNDKIFPVKYSLSLWKALISPWKSEQGQNVPWPFYITTNWCFYSSLFSHFMMYRFPSDVYNTSLVDLESISDLLDIFCEQNTLDILKAINDMVESVELVQDGALVSHIKHCGENRFNCLIYSDTLNRIVQHKIGEIQVSTSQQISSSPRIKNLFTKGSKTFRGDFDTRIKLMKKLSSKLSILYSDIRDFDITKTPSIYSPRSFIGSNLETPQSVSDFYIEGELEGNAFQEGYHSMKKLTPIGIDLVVTGKYKCDKMDVSFNKKRIYRPIESNEISWLVAPLIKVSEKYSQKYGKDIDFRVLANVSNLLFILVVVLFLYFVFLLKSLF